MNLTTSVDTSGRTARVHLAGDLDYVTTADVVDSVRRLLGQQPGLRHLRLECSGLTFCDSAGLSGLLQIHRHTSHADVILHLERRPPHLERILQITGTLEYLTADTDSAQTAGAAEQSGDTEVTGRGERNA
ncbi:anti-sigma factor antagonist [Mycolicibacterium moriokaense]|nr:anti-sigma factor antagonist [Mycolicibacterium moriokaense]